MTPLSPLNVESIALHTAVTAFMQPGISEGWLTPERACEMADLVLATQPETIVSIGVFGGRSIVAFALALKALGKGKVFGIDPWKTADCTEGETKANQDWWEHNVDLHEMHKRSIEAIWRLGLDDYAILIRTGSHRLPRLFPGGIDILEIDGSHVEKAVCRDVEMYLPQLNTNGWVIMDDLGWTDDKGNRTTLKAQEMVLKECILVRTSPDGNWGLFNKRNVDDRLKFVG